MTLEGELNSVLSTRKFKINRNCVYWPMLKTPWVQPHINFVEPSQGARLLLVINAFTKWLEVEIMLVTAEKAVEVLPKLLAQHRLHKTILTDNGHLFLLN